MLALKMYFRMHALVNSIYNDSSNQIIQSINIIQHNIGYNKKSISDINNSNIIIADQGQVLSWFSYFILATKVMLGGDWLKWC